MTARYRLEDIDTTDFEPVANEVEKIHAKIFPDVDGSFIGRVFKQVSEMFAGNYKNYQAMDTVYHDFEHTLQVTLCLVRLMANRHRLGTEPVMTATNFRIGLTAILFHDVGYLKTEDDHEGTGAKFTFVHEQRSCEFADIYLEDQSWPKSEIFAVQHLISCTGPRSVIDAIPFTSKVERIMGEAVCTADYLGQMSDPNYVDKLPVLFKEFEESDDYREVPKEDRLFKTFEDLLRGTPFFWEKIVLSKLNMDCHGLYRFLAEPYPDGENPYVDKIKENLGVVRQRIAKLNAA